MPRRPPTLVLVVATVVATVVAVLAGATAPLSAGPTGTTIVVRVAAERAGADGAPVPLAGVVVRAHPVDPPEAVAGECTTEASGACSITGLAPGVYRVAPAAAPPGSGLTLLGPVEPASGIVDYGEMVEVGEGTHTTRTLVLARDNPVVSPTCGLRVTLLYDVSGSISASEAGAMTAASLGLVDALAGTASSVGIATFATTAPAAGNVTLAPTEVRTALGAAQVRSAIESLTQPSGEDRYTNWDAGLRSVVGTSDVVVLLTDANPTVHGVPAVYPPVTTDLVQIDAGVLSANAVKAAGARIVAVGVGDRGGLARANLAAVSGPVEGVDHVVTSFTEVSRVLRRLATGLCPGPEPVPVPPRFTG